MTRLSWNDRRSELKSACERTGKRRFRSQEQAERVIALSAGRYADGDVSRQEQRAYECAGDNACGGWHVSSKTRYSAPRTPIPAQSAKRRVEQAERTRALRAVFGTNPICARCGGPADDCHELLSRARGGSITDPANLVALCRPCHTWVTTEPAQAAAAGWALSRSNT